MCVTRDKMSCDFEIFCLWYTCALLAATVNDLVMLQSHVNNDNNKHEHGVRCANDPNNICGKCNIDYFPRMFLIRDNAICLKTKM